MKTLLHSPLLVLALSISGVTVAQDEGPTSEFGEPLVVNGEHISDLEIMRSLVYGPGRNALEARKLEILMQQEVELRRELEAQERFQAGYEDISDEQKQAIDASFSHLKITRDHAKARIAEQVVDFKERYPTLDPPTETRRAYKTVGWYEDQVFQTMRFDELFFPGHPDDWPELSIEAIHAGSPNFDLIQDYATHYELRAQKAAETGEPIEPEQDMMMSLLRDYVMGAMNSLVDTRSAIDGIDPELVLEIEGLGVYDEIATREVFEEFKHAFTWRDIADAKRFLALQVAARQKLEFLGVLQDRDEFVDQVRVTREQLSSNMFNWDFIALMGHQFPSQEAYTEHIYLLESFKKVIAEDLQRDGNGNISANLEAYLDHAEVVMGLGRCLTEICFVSAFDFPTNEWRGDNFSEAEQHAVALRKEVDAYIDRLLMAEQEKQAAVGRGENYVWPEDLPSFDRYWSDFLDLNSEFWDPPLPMTGKAAPEMGRKNKGRLNGEPMTRNDYKRAIGESSYYYYLYNTSTTDQVFMEQDEGSVGGPYIAPFGYYIVYLRQRVDPTNPLDMKGDRHFTMVVEDYARNEFTKFAHQALLEAEVTGFPDGLGN